MNGYIPGVFGLLNGIISWRMIGFGSRIEFITCGSFEYHGGFWSVAVAGGRIASSWRTFCLALWVLFWSLIGSLVNEGRAIAMICIVPGSLLPLGVGSDDTELGSGSFDTATHWNASYEEVSVWMTVWCHDVSLWCFTLGGSLFHRFAVWSIPIQSVTTLCNDVSLI